jgi:hypothetical protein
MRFSQNGYYIEHYVKCATCGMLVYGEGIAGTRHGKPCTYCTPWCVEWATLTDRDTGYVRLPIVQPRLPIEDKVQRPARTGEPDPVMMSILDATMVSICREMGILLMRTSYSTIFNEGLDFTCALADAKGDMIACAEFCPTMIGGMPLLIKTCAQEIPFETLEEGDIGLLRRGDRDLPRGPARPAGEDPEEGPGRRRGGLEAAPRQRPHPAPELWRPARHDRRGRPGRRPHRRDRGQVRRGGLHPHLREPDGLCRAPHARGAFGLPRRQVRLLRHHRE